jgi:hypothetical protein
MSSRKLFASIRMASLLAIGLLGFTPVASAASGSLILLHPGKSAANNVVEIKSRDRGPRLYTPIAPSYLYYDYPYYYSRGHYPTHIGPGFIYYGYPYSYYKSRYYLSKRPRRN